MSTTIGMLITEAGYDLSTKEGATWLKAQTNQFEELIVAAEDLVEAFEYAESEQQYAEAEKA